MGPTIRRSSRASAHPSIASGRDFSKMLPHEPGLRIGGLTTIQLVPRKTLPQVPQAWFQGLPGTGDQHDAAQLRDMLKWPVELLKTAPDTARSGVSAPRQCSPASSNGTPASRGGSRPSFRRWCWSPRLWTSCLSPAPTPVPQRVVRQHDIDSTHHGCSIPGLGA